MRIERRGQVAPLTPRVKRFLTEALGGVELDAVLHAEERKADYACLHGLLAVELKSLEESPSGRMDNLIDDLRQREDWPEFLGSAPLQSFVQHLDAPESARLKLLDRLGRAIKSHLRLANKQLAAHASRFPRKNLVRLMILVNEDHEMYDPKVVGYILHHALTRIQDGELLYPNVDAVLYLTERHALPLNGKLTFPILSVESANMDEAGWKEYVIGHVLEKWADWGGTPLFRSGFEEHSFTTIEHIPEMMRRQETWELAYRRNPYMRTWSDERVRAHFDETICVGALAFTKNSPYKPPREVIAHGMQSMSHLMLEMGWRAIPVTQFPSSPERLAQAAERLGLPAKAVDWLRRDMGQS